MQVKLLGWNLQVIENASKVVRMEFVSNGKCK